MKTNNEIMYRDFEDLVKNIDKDKFHITRQIEYKNNKVVITKWEIFSRDFDVNNPTVLASYKGNTLQDIANFIEYNKNKENRNIEAKIFDKLVSLGLPANGLTIRYWDCLLIKLYNLNRKEFRTMKLCNEVAEEFNTSMYAVERALRYGAKKMENNIIAQYGLPENTKITTTTIINIFSERIFYNEI